MEFGSTNHVTNNLFQATIDLDFGCCNCFCQLLGRYLVLHSTFSTEERRKWVIYNYIPSNSYDEAHDRTSAARPIALAALLFSPAVP